MSYLGRIAARASGRSLGVPAQGGVRPAPTMRIDSPIVASDQRLGLPQFASLMALDSPAAEHADFAPGTPPDERARAPINSADEARSLATESRSREALQRWRRPSEMVAAEALQVDLASTGEPPAGPLSTQRQPQAAHAALAQTRSARVESPSITQTPAPRYVAAHTVEPTRLDRPEPLAPKQRAALASSGLAAAMTEVNAWLGAGNPARDPEARAASRRFDPSAAGGHEATLPSALRANAVESAPQQRLTNPALLSATPALPSPAAAPAEAVPLIRIGRIEVEVVPPANAAQVRHSAPAGAQRAPRAPRSNGFHAPRRGFGWRQR